MSPEPAYIAAAAAANVATSEIVGEFELEDRDFAGAAVAPGALALLNAFLDRLLFNVLTGARGATSLAALRPAVVDVLKPRLAREAITGADEELQEYLGTDDEELAAADEAAAAHGAASAAADWDMDLVWRRTRLRCMVYTRLGDMEEEDEDLYMDSDSQHGPAAGRSNSAAAVSPAVAIFLTAVLEHVAESALGIAAQAAFIRVETRARLEHSQALRRILVEEGDMEKVALNSTLGRLWRSWRKVVRSPRSRRSSVSRMSRDGGGRMRGLHTTSTSRKTSIASIDSSRPPLDGAVAGTTQPPSVAEVLDQKPEDGFEDEEGEVDPCAVALPLSEHDVAEIEVPGYSGALAPQKQHRFVDRRAAPFRPFSMYHAAAVDKSNARDQATADQEDADDEGSETSTPRAAMLAFPTGRPRSNSLPTPQTPYFILPDTSETDSAFETPFEEVPPSELPLSTTKRESTAMTRAESDRGVPSSQQQPSQQSLPTEKRHFFTVPSKPNSAPSSPYHGSVLNALSRHVARDFEVQTTKPVEAIQPRRRVSPAPLPPSFSSAQPQSQKQQQLRQQLPRRDSHSEVDPADGALQFGRDDYKIDDNERIAAEAAAAAAVTAREVAPPPAPPKNRHRPPRLPLQKPSPDRANNKAIPGTMAAAPPPPVTPRNFSKPTSSGSGSVAVPALAGAAAAAAAAGDVSPIEPTSIDSGEVSPIESGYEDELEDAKGPEAVSPLMQRSFAPSPPRVAPVRVPSGAETGREAKQQIPIGAERQRRRGGPTEDDYVKEEKREAYVLPEEYSGPTTTGAVPAPKAAPATGKRATEATALANKELPPIDQSASSSKKRYRAAPSADVNGAPNLAPLRELMEAAPDTSDEASSLAPSQTDRPKRTTSASPAHGGPTSAPGVALTSDLRRQVPPSSSGQAGGAIASQRVAAPLAAAATIEPARRSRQSSDSTRRKPAHHEASVSQSSGTSPNNDDAYSRSSASPRDRQKSFEQLMNSGETIQYTLTPQTMLEIEVSSQFSFTSFVIHLLLTFSDHRTTD